MREFEKDERDDFLDDSRYRKAAVSSFNSTPFFESCSLDLAELIVTSSARSETDGNKQERETDRQNIMFAAILSVLLSPR